VAQKGLVLAKQVLLAPQNNWVPFWKTDYRAQMIVRRIFFPLLGRGTPEAPILRGILCGPPTRTPRSSASLPQFAQPLHRAIATRGGANWSPPTIRPGKIHCSQTMLSPNFAKKCGVSLKSATAAWYTTEKLIKMRGNPPNKYRLCIG